MNKALWIVQGLLAAAFLMVGLFKATTPSAELIAQLPWIETTGILAARVAGGAELLGAIGLILPSLLRFQPKLTPLAALGLVAVMVGAVATHTMRGEFAALAPNFVLMSLAGFVAWGRTFKSPIEPRMTAEPATA